MRQATDDEISNQSGESESEEDDNGGDDDHFLRVIIIYERSVCQGTEIHTKIQRSIPLM